MTVRLADLQIRTPQFSNYVAHRILATNAFYNSGALRVDAALDGFATSGLGQTLTLPFYNAIDDSVEPNVSNDNPASFAIPQGFSSDAQTAHKLMLNQHWRGMDLNTALNGENPLNEVGNQIADYWSVQASKHLVSIGVGILADNANDADDMLVGTGATPPAMSAAAIINAKQTSGDRKGIYTGIAMHSQVHTNLEIQNLITTVRDSDNNTSFQVFNNLFVVVDDSLPVVAGPPEIYTSMLFGPGAFMLGRGAPETPFETTRDALSGGGEGANTLSTRQHLVLHPDGFNFTGTPAAQSATRAELETAAFWDRVVDRKRVPLAFIRSQG